MISQHQLFGNSSRENAYIYTSFTSAYIIICILCMFCLLRISVLDRTTTSQWWHRSAFKSNRTMGSGRCILTGRIISLASLIRGRKSRTIIVFHYLFLTRVPYNTWMRSKNDRLPGAARFTWKWLRPCIETVVPHTFRLIRLHWNVAFWTEEIRKATYPRNGSSIIVYYCPRVRFPIDWYSGRAVVYVKLLHETRFRHLYLRKYVYDININKNPSQYKINKALTLR